MTKLLVLSDSHGGRAAIERVLMKESKSIDALIFLGDGLRDLELALTQYPKLRAYSVAGNCDYGALEPTDGLAAFDGVDVAALKGQITTLTNDLQTERDNRKKDAAAVKLRSTVDTFLSGKHFVNDITRESITDKLVTALGAASRSTTCLPALSPIGTARRSPASLWPIPPARRAFRPITAAWCRRRGAQKNT